MLIPTRVLEYHANSLNNGRVILFENSFKMVSERIYHISFDELPTKDDLFTFSMPSLLINNKEVAIPVVTFTKIMEWRMEMVVLNC